MRKKYAALLCIAVEVLFLCTAVAAGAQDKQTEEKVQLLTLRNKNFGIQPESVIVKKGTTVVWYNKDPEPVVVSFSEPMGPSCDAPVNFHLGLDGTYESGIIPQSGIAGMCIVIPGTYEYKVERRMSKGTSKPVMEISKGRITVQ